MRFTPQDTAKLEEGGDYEILPPGEYDFEVTKAEDTKSKSSGNDQIKLTLAVFNGGDKYVVWDYLTGTEKSQWKAYGFCKAVGLVEEFKAGELTAFHCGGRTGSLKLGIQPAKGEYDEKNIVKAYIALDDLVTKPGAKAVTPPEEDDIPF